MQHILVNDRNTVNQFTQTNPHRVKHLLARVRHAQLNAARDGRMFDSAIFADRAKRLQSLISTQAPRVAAALVLGMSVLLFSSTAFASGGASGGGASGGTPVRVADAQSQVLTDRQRVTGSLRAVSRSAVAAEEAGAVAMVLTDEGKHVQTGQIIARLDADRHEARLAEMQANLATQQAIIAQYEAELTKAQTDLQVLTELLARQAATEREHRDATTAVQVAKARVHSAKRQVETVERQVDLARIQLQDLTIKSPFDGRVVRRHVEPGEWVNPGDAIVTLVSSGKIEAQLEVPERFAATLNNPTDNLSIEVQTAAGSLTSQTLRAVPEVDARARTFPVIVELENREGRLSSGMSVTAYVPAGPAQSRLTVPKDAVVRSGYGDYVFVAQSGTDGQITANRTDVRVLFESGDRVAIAEGALLPGDRVIVEGNERLRPGAALSIIESTPPATDTLALQSSPLNTN